MPYIKDEDKEAFSEAINKIAPLIRNKGDLNYVICELVGTVIFRDGISYTQMSEKIDAVHDAETELRRRLLDRYEDLKIIENGDVPSFQLIVEEIYKMNPHIHVSRT